MTDIITEYEVSTGGRTVDVTTDPERAEAYSRDGYRVTATTGDDDA